MKKLLLMLVLGSTLTLAASAQDANKHKDETKVKKTSTMGQKVHNTLSKHKRYKGHKAKHKVVNGKG